MALKYISTRGTAPALNFEDVMLTGLATDGGLYVPEACPKISEQGFKAMQGKSYVDVAHKVIFPFVEGSIDDGTLHGLLKDTYAQFHDEKVAPIVSLDENLSVMELFHGPTLAFKDFALQFLGRMFDYSLSKRGQKITVVGATSGDTGSAAIEACRDRDSVEIFILHPKDRVSDVQRRQMTAVTSLNVHNIAIEGSFDDCQDMVKSMFNDQNFRQEINMSAINSINWARICAQVAYYVYAWVQMMDKVDRISFVVPTGNFGNIYAGYVAQSMGVPMDKLIVATNKNDILHRFFQTGKMEATTVEPTLSPSMDIQISSNFERLLFDLYGRDGAAVVKTMDHFRQNGPFEMDDETMARLHVLFDSARLNDEETSKVIKMVHEKMGYLSDPHTAVGLGAALQYREKYPETAHLVTLATADPSKFPDAVEKASGVFPELPTFLSDLHQREEKYDVLPNDLNQVMTYIRQNMKQSSAA